MVSIIWIYNYTYSGKITSILSVSVTSLINRVVTLTPECGVLTDRCNQFTPIASVILTPNY